MVENLEGFADIKNMHCNMHFYSIWGE